MPQDKSKDIAFAVQAYKDAGVADPLATQLGTAYVNLLYAGFKANIVGIGIPAGGPP